MNEYFDFDLTDDQQKALEFLNSDDKILLLTGSAGVGKTTVVQIYANINPRKKIILAAPTHKAANKLRDKGFDNCKTIHSFLKMRKVFEKNKYIFKASIRDFNDVDTDILIVDEASMLDDYLIDSCLFFAKEFGFRVIFVGDEKQINPVNCSNSPVFHKGFKTFEILEIVRHQNDIIELSRNLGWIKKRKSGTNFGFVNRINLNDLVKANGTDDAKFICYTNRMVSKINSAVRNCIYGQPKQFEIGEVLLLNAAYTLTENGVLLCDYKNSEEVKINKVNSTVNYFDKFQVLFPELFVKIINTDLICVADEFLDKYKANLNDLEYKAKNKLISWKLYYDYQDNFVNYQYNHAITVHKSQGSTFKKSFVNTVEILNKTKRYETNRLLYTAVTRASDYNVLI